MGNISLSPDFVNTRMRERLLYALAWWSSFFWGRDLPRPTGSITSTVRFLWSNLPERQTNRVFHHHATIQERINFNVVRSSQPSTPSKVAMIHPRHLAPALELLNIHGASSVAFHQKLSIIDQVISY
jgi:hypothetical protein